jgi:6-phosphofructokinase 1
MKPLHGACIVAQSGGPTSVINASLLGVIQAAMKFPAINRVLGALNGIQGLLQERLIDLGQEDPHQLEHLRYTPSSALGSCRYKLASPEENEQDYQRLLAVFRKYQVRYFFYIGGNDSMDTCLKVSRFMERADYPCRVIGVPKTIDNDLVGTDHCPGYGSAAKMIATTCAELRQDTQVYQTPTVNILEIMGRHAGWLAASAALASVIGQGPDLVYLPERNFSMEQFLEDVAEVVRRRGNCVVAVSEGIHYADGTYLTQVKTAAGDGFGHVQLGGLGVFLAQQVKDQLGFKSRGLELSLLQRCSAHIASETDIREAYESGYAAVGFAVDGETGIMVSLKRLDHAPSYRCETAAVDLALVANLEKAVPLCWINERGNGVTQDFIDYALPLIQGAPDAPHMGSLPCYARLKRIPATPAQEGDVK